MTIVECTRCLMNNQADKSIRFNMAGMCHHCERFDTLKSTRISHDKAEYQALINTIKKQGVGKKYDCIVGVSGGVDSTYVIYQAKKAGLRPLAVHFDNGWNTDLAVKNIENALKKLDVELYTYVVDWREFRDLQLSFLKAAVPDGEIPTDHAISATLWKTARKFGVRTILSGLNFATEAVHVPDWSYGHVDWKYIKSVHKKFGSKTLKTFPRFSLTQLLIYNAVYRIKTVSILNYLPYNKEQAKKTLEAELGWKPYQGKHYESFYTRFYQGYILPNQFGIDKRIGHLSDLINAGQIEKEAARIELKEEPLKLDTIEFDKEYVAKKFGVSLEELETLISAKPNHFSDFPNSFTQISMLKSFVNTLRGRGLYPK